MLPNPKPYFDKVPDPRRETENKLHALSDILSIALCAIISGCDDWEEVAAFGRIKESWFRKFLPLSNGIPSHDTFRRVFYLIDSKLFEAAFLEWTRQANIASLAEEQIALDGKTVCRSHKGKRNMSMTLRHSLPTFSVFSPRSLV